MCTHLLEDDRFQFCVDYKSRFTLRITSFSRCCDLGRVAGTPLKTSLAKSVQSLSFKPLTVICRLN